MAIAECLSTNTDGISIRFVSYGTGAATFRSCGVSVVDMKLPDNNPLLETIVCCTQIVASLKPQLVVAHEEVGALLGAKVFNTPSIFITDFFQEPTMLATKLLEYADEVIFIGNPGTFTEPPSLRQKIRYVGAAVRPFKYHRSDRTRARAELGLPAEGTVISCMPGSWRESYDPIADILINAFDGLNYEPKRLVWLAGDDHDLLASRFAARSDVIIKQHDWQIDRLMVASDLVITKSNRVTLRELNALGIPSISLSHATNWPDDVVAAQISTNLLLDVKGLDGAALSAHIVEKLRDSLPSCESPWPPGVSHASLRLKLHIDAHRGMPL
jgi:hypothetical protein